MIAACGRIRSALHAIFRDTKGVSVIEFAFMAPVLAFTIMGMSDLARGFSEKLTLEQAAHRALERAAVGSVQSGSVTGTTDYSYLRAEAATAAGIPQSNVTVTTWLECDRVRQPDFNGVCGANQMISRYVRVDLVSTFRPSFDYSQISRRIFNTAPNGTIAIAAGAALRVQ